MSNIRPYSTLVYLIISHLSFQLMEIKATVERHQVKYRFTNGNIFITGDTDNVMKASESMNK